MKYKSEDVTSRDNIDNLQEVKIDYSGVSLDHLLMFVLDEMEKNNIRLSFPNITVSAWRIFPDKFSLFGFREYPDSNRMQTCIWHLVDKKKRWIAGTKNQFIITEKGAAEIGVARDILKQPKKKKYLSKTRVQEKMLKQVEETEAYKKFSNGKSEAITQFDLYELLQCTLDSSRDILKENFDTLVILATQANSAEMLEFFNIIKRNFEEIKNA